MIIPVSATPGYTMGGDLGVRLIILFYYWVHLYGISLFLKDLPFRVPCHAESAPE